MQNELDIVRDVSGLLEQGGLTYMLTGSMAMNYYPSRRSCSRPSSRSQSVILKRGENIKYRPYAFTHHGALMLANVKRPEGRAPGGRGAAFTPLQHWNHRTR